MSIFKAIGWFSRLKLRFAIWVVMIGGLIFGGAELASLVTHDHVEGRIVKALDTCDLRCLKISQKPKGIGPASCGRIEQLIAQGDLVGCRADPRHEYDVRVAGRDGAPSVQRLRSQRLWPDYSVGQTIPLMRAQNRLGTVRERPGGFALGFLAAGLSIFLWKFGGALARGFGWLRGVGARTPAPAPAYASGAGPVPRKYGIPKLSRSKSRIGASTGGALAKLTRRGSRTAKPIRSSAAKVIQGRGYIIRGPVKTYRR